MIKKYFLLSASIFVLAHSLGCGLGTALDVLAPRDPLLYAASTGDVEKIRYLVKNEGRSISYKDASGETALHHAARWCKDKAIPVIVELGGETDARSNNNDAPLHIAASKLYCQSTITNLLNAGANINSIGSEGETALHKAVKWAEFTGVEIVKLLFDRGAITTKRDDSGKTPAERAQSILAQKRDSLVTEKINYQTCLTEKAKDPNKFCEDHSNGIQRIIDIYLEIVRILK